MNTLQLNFNKTKYPYHDEVYDESMVWGKIELNVLDEQQIKIQALIDIEWDVKEFVSWLLHNKSALFNDQLIISENTGEQSIAQQIYQFYNDDACFDEQQVDALFNYRQQHGLRFALRGTDILDIYIGANQGHYEISFYDGDQAWDFEIDLAVFIQNIENAWNDHL